MENVRNIACVIAYDGSKFCGFATQDSKVDSKIDSKIAKDSIKKLQNTESNLPSIQDFITMTLQKIGINTKIIAAGRTDKNVHATYQVINFYAYYNPKKKSKKLENIESKNIQSYDKDSINSLQSNNLDFKISKDSNKNLQFIEFKNIKSYSKDSKEIIESNCNEDSIKKLQNIESNLKQDSKNANKNLENIESISQQDSKDSKDSKKNIESITLDSKNIQISQLKPHKMSLNRMKKLLNEKLFPHIKIRKIYEVSPNFHARFCAKSRTYTYIFSDKEMLPFFTPYIAKVKFGDIKKIKIALNAFVGTHDFSLFKKNGSETKDNIRHIFSTKILTKKVYNLPCNIIQIKANGFLRSQVRMLLNACFAYSLGKISLQNLKAQIDNKMDVNDRICLRELAPACGLYLSRVEY